MAHWRCPTPIHCTGPRQGLYVCCSGLCLNTNEILLTAITQQLSVLESCFCYLALSKIEPTGSRTDIQYSTWYSTSYDNNFHGHPIIHEITSFKLPTVSHVHEIFCDKITVIVNASVIEIDRAYPARHRGQLNSCGTVSRIAKISNFLQQIDFRMAPPSVFRSQMGSDGCDRSTAK